MSKFFLGLHYGHNATVAVSKNGEIIFCQSEERLNRIKNSTGFPTLTLNYIYENICTPDKIDSVTLFQESIMGYLFLKKHDFKSFQYGYYLSPELKNGGMFSRSELKWQLSQWRARNSIESYTNLRAEALDYFSRSTGVPEKKIKFIKQMKKVL